MAILAVNAGSSSLKFSLHPLEGGQVLPHTVSGNFQGLEPGGQPQLGWKYQGQKHEETLAVPAGEAPFHVALARLRALVHELAASQGLHAIAHRVVHGGGEFSESVQVTDEVLARLTRFNSLAPLHQPHNLEGIRQFREAFPEVPQVACFDTAFHARMPEVDYAFALPKALQEQGVRRYGFHGLSYQYVMSVLEKETIRGRGRVVMAHLGNGASVCAVRNGRSVDTSMGMTPLEGLMMGTRSGDVDFGAMAWIAAETRQTLSDLERVANTASGLLGISGLSSDLRVLEQAWHEGHARARLAIKTFVHRIARHIAGHAAALQRLDGIIFTGGIGENSVLIRRLVSERLAVFGLEMDAARNQQPNSAGERLISADGSRVRCAVIPTNEERMIALDAIRLGRIHTAAALA